MCRNQKIKIIFNPNAHSGTSNTYLELLESTLNQQNIQYVVYKTTKPKDAILLSQKNIDDNDTVLIIGGDGTVFETINGTIKKNNIKYCIIPAGTGNDLYFTIGNNFSFKQLQKRLREDSFFRCNLSIVNRDSAMSLFLAYGVVIDIIKECRKRKKKSRLCYIKAAGKSLIFHKPTVFKYAIDNDDFLSVKADYIGVHNAPTAGGGMVISPFSKIDDDKFELVVLEYSGFIRRVLNFIAILRNKIDKQPNYKSVTCEKVQIDSMQDNIYCIDGEMFLGKYIEVILNKKSIQLFV